MARSERLEALKIVGQPVQQFVVEANGAVGGNGSDYCYHITNYELRVTNYEFFLNYELGIRNYEFFELRIRSYELRVFLNYELFELRFILNCHKQPIPNSSFLIRNS